VFHISQKSAHNVSSYPADKQTASIVVFYTNTVKFITILILISSLTPSFETKTRLIEGYENIRVVILLT